MLRIRPKQIAALGGVMRTRFEERMVAHLRTLFPQLTQRRAHAEILSFVRIGVARAAVYGVVVERDVQRYIEYMIMYGPRFDEDARYRPLAEVLNRADLSGTSKMNRIDDYDQFVHRR
jgi:hypothetical protein